MLSWMARCGHFIGTWGELRARACPRVWGRAGGKGEGSGNFHGHILEGNSWNGQLKFLPLTMPLRADPCVLPWNDSQSHDMAPLGPLADTQPARSPHGWAPGTTSQGPICPTHQLPRWTVSACPLLSYHFSAGSTGVQGPLSPSFPPSAVLLTEASRRKRRLSDGYIHMNMWVG